MKETKVYVDELPENCSKCLFCYDNRPYWKSTDCILLRKELDEYEIETSVNENCPLQSIKTHDRELVRQVCEKISIELENETGIYCEIRQCNSPHYQGDYVWFNYVKFRKLAEKLQKEFEK